MCFSLKLFSLNFDCCVYNLSVYTIHILQICVCSLNIVEWGGFKVLSGCIRPEGRFLFTPVEWWSHKVSKLSFRWNTSFQHQPSGMRKFMTKLLQQVAPGRNKMYFLSKNHMWTNLFSLFCTESDIWKSLSCTKLGLHMPVYNTSTKWGISSFSSISLVTSFNLTKNCL